MGGLVGWEIALLPAAMLAVAAAGFLGAWLGARRPGPWVVHQERMWEVLHALHEVARERGERPERARMHGRLGGARASVTVSGTSVVVEHRSSPGLQTIDRAPGTHVEIELALPRLEGAFVARTVAPIDDEDEGDAWSVSERTCEALGAPFQADAEPPGWLVEQLGAEGLAALGRLAHFDVHERRGWLRVGIEVAEGRVRLEGVAIDAGLEEMLAVASAIAGPSPVIASADPYRGGARARPMGPPPPMPPLAPRRGLDRVWTAAGAASIESAIVAPSMIGFFLGYGAIALLRFAQPLDETVTEAWRDDEGEQTLRLGAEGLSYRVGPRDLDLDHVCPNGSTVHKRAWSGALECEHGIVQTELVLTSVIPPVLGGIGMLALAIYAYRDRRRDRGPPRRLPDRAAQ